MDAILGTSLAVYIGFFVFIMGFAAFMTGMALANTWRPFWQAIPYSLMLAAAGRFLIYGLFDGELLTLSGYVADSIVLFARSTVAYRATLARKMASQYPWIYEMSGPFAWKRRNISDS